MAEDELEDEDQEYHEDTYDKCFFKEPGMEEVNKTPNAISPFLYVAPKEDIDIHKSGYYPDGEWPDPYEETFDHVKDGVAWEAKDDDAFFITDNSSEVDCKNELDQAQIDYINSCYDSGVIPNKKFLKNLKEKSISLRSQGIDCDEILAMCKLLSENLTVTSLDLSDNQIKEQGAYHLARLLQENDTIFEMDLSYNGIGNAGCRKILESLAKTGFSLNFAGNDITDKSMPIIADALKEEGKLKSLDLSDNRLGQFPAEPEKCLQVALASNWSLEKLDLSWNNFIGNQVHRLLIGIKENPSISWLNLSHNRISDKECPLLFKCLANNRTLQYLDISANFITTVGARSIAKAIKTNDTLSVLKIGQNHLDVAGALALLQAYSANEKSSLQILDLGDTNVNSAFISLEEKLSDRQIEIKHGYEIRNIGFKDRPWNKLMEKYIDATKEKPKKGKDKKGKDKKK